MESDIYGQLTVFVTNSLIIMLSFAVIPTVDPFAELSYWGINHQKAAKDLWFKGFRFSLSQYWEMVTDYNQYHYNTVKASLTQYIINAICTR